MIRAADLFCGAGGTSTGILKACADRRLPVDLLAVNHWTTAINTHSLNHPHVRHLCESLDNIAPQRAITGGHLHLLAASPECTHHSKAAGGRPRNEQSRATAWHICRWAADLRVDNIFIENVTEFADWGPLTKMGKPMKRRKGETFKAFTNALRAMGYHVEHRVQNAADFGDPTSRRRLIVLARRSPVQWPKESHTPKTYRTAREVIDWGLKGKSIFNRKKPLAANTLRRIAAGLRKFGGASAEPFLVMLYGTNKARSVDRPAPTVTAHGNHIGLAQPFIIQTDQTGGGPNMVRSLDEPTYTVVSKQNMAVVEPFLVKFHGDHDGRNDGERRAHGTDAPLPTLDTSNRFGLVEPMLIGQQSCAAARPVSQPAPTISTAGTIALVEPFLVKYYGNERAAESVDEPLDTVTTKDRFLLVEPKTGRAVAELDILFRMLQPHELAAAMSFPKDYQFTGNKEAQVKQIGNAVPVELARAHINALLS